MKKTWKKLFQQEPNTAIESNILHLIKANPFSILDMTIDEFALRCYTTKSTVVKALQKIGLTGYKELKSVIYNDTLIAKGEQKNLSTEGKSALNNIHASDILLEESGIKNISNIINLSSKVCIVASDFSFNIAKDFRRDLNTIGIRAETILASDPNFWIEDYDCIIFISGSGVNKQIYNRCKYICSIPKHVRPKIISITSINTSNIESMSNLYLPGSKYISITEKENHISTQAILVLWFTIVRIIEELYSSNINEVRKRLKYLSE